MQALAVNPQIELTAHQVAELKGCSDRHIRDLVSSGALHGEKRLNERNRPVYYIPLSALDIKLQDRYFKQRRQDLPAVAEAGPAAERKSLDQYTLQEREQIHFWTTLIEDWQTYRGRPEHPSRAEADETFVAFAKVAYLDEYCRIHGKPFKLSTDTLYRRWRAFRDGNAEALIEKRGKALKGASSMPPVVWDAFLSFYLDQAQHPISRCYEYTKLWLREKQPELLGSLPAYSTFYRKVRQEIPEPLQVLGREGEKAFRDRCAPYIRRVYDDMRSNEYWIADTHTFDIISKDEDGRQHRLHLVAFFDARSGIFTGCHIAEQPSSQATLVALRKGILRYGIPDNIYVDNGREFLTFDVGGLGHRKRKPKNGAPAFEPPAVFKRLGITMINAQVRNARAKIIERRFRDVKDQLSRLFETYTGGNVMERPEQLKHVLKAGRIPTDAELIQAAETLLDFYFNQQEYHGAVGRDAGKPRMQVYLENLTTKRVASEDDLNLMMMRSTKAQKVSRRGVHLRIAGQKIDFWTDELVSVMFGQQVYLRYDPDDLSEVRVYDLEDRYLLTAPADSDAVRKYGTNTEDLTKAIKKIQRYERMQKEVLRNSGLEAYDRVSALDLVLAQADANRSLKYTQDGAKVLQLEQVTEAPLLEKAVGYDIDTMLKNAEKYHEGGRDLE